MKQLNNHIILLYILAIVFASIAVYQFNQQNPTISAVLFVAGFYCCMGALLAPNNQKYKPLNK